MIKVSILYPNIAGGRFDADYYFERHMPMSLQRLAPALKGVSLEQGISGDTPGTPPPYLIMSHLLFDSLEDFEAAFAPHAEELIGDIPNYTDIEPVIQFSEVKYSAAH